MKHNHKPLTPLVVLIGWLAIAFIFLFAFRGHAQTNFPPVENQVAIPAIQTQPSQPEETNTMPAFAAVDKTISLTPTKWSDKLDVKVGFFVNTRNAQLKNSIGAVMVSYGTGDNTFIGIGGYAGLNMRGGGELVGGLKSVGTLKIPVVNYTLHTQQWVCDGLAYVSGSSGTPAFGIQLPARHGWENYFASGVEAQFPHFGIGISTLMVGPDIYLGAGVNIPF